MPALVVLLALFLAGCTPQAKPFMGVLEDREVKIDGESALAGLPKMTAVQEVPWQAYLDHKKQGDIQGEESRGNWLYFAVRKMRFVPMGGMQGEPGQPIEAMIFVTERYRTRAPQ